MTSAALGAVGGALGALARLHERLALLLLLVEPLLQEEIFVGEGVGARLGEAVLRVLVVAAAHEGVEQVERRRRTRLFDRRLQRVGARRREEEPRLLLRTHVEFHAGRGRADVGELELVRSPEGVIDASQPLRC